MLKLVDGEIMREQACFLNKIPMRTVRSNQKAGVLMLKMSFSPYPLTAKYCLGA